MARTFYLVTPCGRKIEEAHDTVASAVELATAHPSVDFVHYLVFNNGLSPEPYEGDLAPNYRAVVSDLGEVGSRAMARNSALDAIEATGVPGLVCFMDAGDVLLDHGALAAAFRGVERDPDSALWAFSARIVGSDISSTRRPRPLGLRKINNPFFIGATFVTSELATKARFGEGAKEDWKYWLELLETSPRIGRRPEIAYEYRVISTTDHLNRKSRLMGDQYRFFSNHLGYGHSVRTWGSMVAHTAIAGTSWLRRSTRFRPWTWRR